MPEEKPFVLPSVLVLGQKRVDRNDQGAVRDLVNLVISVSAKQPFSLAGTRKMSQAYNAGSPKRRLIVAGELEAAVLEGLAGPKGFKKLTLADVEKDITLHTLSRRIQNNVPLPV